jgi:hypothetical protein
MLPLLGAIVGGLKLISFINKWQNIISVDIIFVFVNILFVLINNIADVMTPSLFCSSLIFNY